VKYSSVFWNLSPVELLKSKGFLKYGAPKVEYFDKEDGCTSTYFHLANQSIQVNRVVSLVLANKNGKSYIGVLTESSNAAAALKFL